MQQPRTRVAQERLSRTVVTTSKYGWDHGLNDKRAIQAAHHRLELRQSGNPVRQAGLEYNRALLQALQYAPIHPRPRRRRVTVLKECLRMSRQTERLPGRAAGPERLRTRLCRYLNRYIRSKLERENSRSPHLTHEV